MRHADCSWFESDWYRDVDTLLIILADVSTHPASSIITRLKVRYERGLSQTEPSTHTSGTQCRKGRSVQHVRRAVPNDEAAATVLVSLVSLSIAKLNSHKATTMMIPDTGIEQSPIHTDNPQASQIVEVKTWDKHRHNPNAEVG